LVRRDYQRNRPPHEVLLIGDVPVDCNKDVEAGGLGGVQKLAVLQSCQIGESGRLAVVAWNQKPKALVNALVESEAASTTRQQQLLGFF
jgi:hypothetical protein